MMIMFLPPDVAWSDQSFKTIGDRLTQGYKSHNDDISQSRRKSISKMYPDFPDKGHHIINLSGRELMKLCIEALHPLMAAYLKDSTHFPHAPRNDVLASEERGVIIACLRSRNVSFRSK